MERELQVLELEQTRTKNSIIPVRSGIEEIQLITQQVTVKNFRSSPSVRRVDGLIFLNK